MCLVRSEQRRRYFCCWILNNSFSLSLRLAYCDYDDNNDDDGDTSTIVGVCDRVDTTYIARTFQEKYILSLSLTLSQSITRRKIDQRTRARWPKEDIRTYRSDRVAKTMGGSDLDKAKAIANEAVGADQAGNASQAAGLYEQAASLMQSAVKKGEVKTDEEKEQLAACVKMYLERAAALKAGSASTAQMETAMAAAKVAGQAQQGVANAGGGKQFAGTAAAGAAAGLFVVGAIGFPITGVVLGASAAAYAAGVRPEGDAAGDIARNTGKVRGHCVDAVEHAYIHGEFTNFMCRHTSPLLSALYLRIRRRMSTIRSLTSEATYSTYMHVYLTCEHIYGRSFDHCESFLIRLSRMSARGLRTSTRNTTSLDAQRVS